MIPTQPFGNTGHMSTRILFGGAAFSDVDQATADTAMESIIAAGINHIDTAASYGNSELRIGPWMPSHRDKFFLATKTGERRFQAAYDEIRRSLERLQTDHVDLIQLHNLVDEAEWVTAFAAGGALEAVIRAREEGLARFAGVTGHGVTVARMHLRSLEQYPFDSVLLPYNYPMMQNPQYAADFDALFSICRDRNIAVQTIKSITQAPWGDREQTTSTWYEPLMQQADIDLAVHWVLGRQGTFLNTASDVGLLPKILRAAKTFDTRPSDTEMDRLVQARSMEPLFV